jgi:multiple sugar transport system permease protein
MSVWKGLGFSMVIFLAGLQNIPEMYYEAARIDGANPFHLFRHITLPLLRPTILFVMVTGVIGSFQVFTQIFIMTNGGPGNATRVLVQYIYESAFRFYRMGLACSMAFVLFGIVLFLTILQIKYFGRGIEF